MAFIGYEHFDLYGTSIADLLLRGYGNVSASGPTTANARTGSHCLPVGAGAGGRGIRRTLDTPRDVFGQGAGWRVGAFENGGTVASHAGFRFGTAQSFSKVRVMPNGDTGGIRVYIDTTLVATSANGLIAAGTWFWLEAKVTCGTGTAIIEVRLNGLEIINLTGQTIVGPVASIGLYSDNSAAGPNMSFDDWVWWDTVGGDIVDFMGDTFVIVADPTADTAVADYVPTPAGTLFSTVDERTPSDTDYIQGNVIADAAEFTHPVFNLGVGAIAAIASQTRAFKSDAGAASYKTGIASVAATSMGEEIALATGPNVHSHIAERNPNGNVSWTQAAANAARLRVERTA
jgi:hypothetical protein